jgi:hypothetical protein
MITTLVENIAHMLQRYAPRIVAREVARNTNVLMAHSVRFIIALTTVSFPITQPRPWNALTPCATLKLINSTHNILIGTVFLIRSIQAVSLSIAVPLFWVAVFGLRTVELVVWALLHITASLVTSIHALTDAITLEVLQDAPPVRTVELSL